MTLVQTLTAPIEECALPTGRGAYALLIRLPHRFQASIGALGVIGLPAGAYLYLGSAHGPGGLRARLRRHLRPEKTRHWHVDYLTEVGEIICILAVPDGHECDLVGRALSCAGVSVPAAGFGSSDCRRCPAHLLSVERDAESVLATLAGRS